MRAKAPTRISPVSMLGGAGTTLALLVACAVFSAAATTQPATHPSTAPATAAVDPAMEKQLEALDARIGRIKDFSASFEQEKFTPILRKPLLSTGIVRVQGATMRWDTQKPRPIVMVIDEKQLEIYYPRQKSLEIYPIGRSLGRLAASPLPRLAVLHRYFSISGINPRELSAEADPARFLALRLTPVDAALAGHLDHVRVLIDLQQACIVKLDMVDADGNRTVMTFTDVQINPGLKASDMELAIPPQTRISRPLEGFSGEH